MARLSATASHQFALPRMNGIVAAAAACAATAGAFAQHDVPILRSDPQDSGITENLPKTESYWYLDTIIDPHDPARRNTMLIPEIIAREFGDYMDGEAWQKAEEAARTLVAVADDRPASHYNLACALARQGKRDEALAALEKALELGWRHYEHLAHLDPDLDSLRADPRFATLISKLEEAINADAFELSALRTEPWETVAAELEQEVPAILARFHVPGASVALIRDGKMVWQGAFGVADDRTADAVTENTRFPVRSGARLLAATLALQLEERGIWDLDDPMTKWLPEATFAGAPRAQAVTLRSAMNFTAGLIYSAPLVIPESIDDEIAQTLRLNADRSGSMYTYTAEAFFAVGRAIERALEPAETSADDPAAEQFDGSYAQLVQARILRRLQMSETILRRPTRDGIPMAVGHTEYGTPYRADIATPRKPADRIYTTASDMATLVALLASGGATCPSPVLSPESIAAISAPGLPLAPLGTGGGGMSRGFGLGTTVYDTPYGRCVEIADVELGCGSLLRWYPESQSGVVILFNADTGYEAARRIAHRALGGI